METNVQVRQRDTLTLLADLREKYGIKPGDTFHLMDLDLLAHLAVEREG
jgi:hypothetical protein